MPLSNDPQKRARQLANLRPGEYKPPLGHTLAVKHGGFARVGAARLAEKVRELYEALGEDLPLRAPDGGVPPADEARLSLCARAMARLEDVERYHDNFGWRDAKTGNPRPSVEVERTLRVEVANHLDALGCSPASRVKLGVDLQRSFDLAKHWADEAQGDYLSEPPPSREDRSPSTRDLEVLERPQIDRKPPEIEPPDELDALIAELEDLEARKRGDRG